MNEQLTYGQKLVGVTFNPSQDPDVAKVKQLFAELIDMLEEKRGRADPFASRHYSIAITEAQTAQMWAVKALTTPIA